MFPDLCHPVGALSLPCTCHVSALGFVQQVSLSPLSLHGVLAVQGQMGPGVASGSLA